MTENNISSHEELPHVEGYTPEKRTISILAANLWAVLLLAAVGVVGWMAMNAIHQDIAFTHIDFMLAALLILVCLVVHELVHGITWLLFLKRGFSHLRFGLMKGAAYCHIDLPMLKHQYVVGALMPLLLVGVVPWAAGILAGSATWLLVGAVLIGGAVGDIMIVWKLRREPSDALVYDHPNEGGCYVYHKNEN